MNWIKEFLVKRMLDSHVYPLMYHHHHRKEDIYEISKDLLKDIYKKREYIRLIGIFLSKLSSRNSNQLTFL